MRQRDSRLNSSLTDTGVVGLEQRLRAALADDAPPAGMPERVMAAVRRAGVGRYHRSSRVMAPVATAALVAMAMAFVFVLVAGVCLAPGPSQALLAQRVAGAVTAVRLQLASWEITICRWLGLGIVTILTQAIR